MSKIYREAGMWKNRTKKPGVEHYKSINQHEIQAMVQKKLT